MVTTTIEKVVKLKQMLTKYNVGENFIVEVNGGVSWYNIKDIYN
jgi:pentose-5-phosphate-3-epimerase